jgi:hypothetical protein
MGKYSRDTGKFFSLGVAVSRVQYSIKFEIRNEEVYWHFLFLQLVSAEGSNVSDGTSQCTDSVVHSDMKVPIERPGDPQ